MVFVLAKTKGCGGPFFQLILKLSPNPLVGFEIPSAQRSVRKSRMILEWCHWGQRNGYRLGEA